MYFKVNQIEILNGKTWYWKADINEFHTFDIWSDTLTNNYRNDYYLGVI